MFSEMRRADRQTTLEQAEQILFSGEYGTLATICSNGYPYATPLSYIYMDGNIYFHCASEGQKLDNINSNPRVCFTVVTDTDVLPSKFTTKYKSAVVYGTASYVTGDEKEKTLLGLIEKYSPAYLSKGKEYISKAFDTTTLIKINPEHITGKANI